MNLLLIMVSAFHHPISHNTFLATFARRKNAMRKKDGEAGDERHQELKGASRAAV